MVLFLCIMISLMICSFTTRKCVSISGVKVNHTLLFSAGFWYYLIFPIIVGETIPQVGGDLWENLYVGIPQSKVIAYVNSLIGLYVVFMLSDTLPVNKLKKGEYVFAKWTLQKWALLCLFCFLFMAYKYRMALFKGYTPSQGITSYVGPMSAIFLVGFTIYIGIL